MSNEFTDKPIFHEHESDEEIPEGYGIDESHDGNYYVYQIREGGIPIYFTDHRGLDLSFAGDDTGYYEALGYISAVAKDRKP